MKWRRVTNGYYLAMGEKGRVYHVVKNEHIDAWAIDGFQYMDTQIIMDAAPKLWDAKRRCEALEFQELSKENGFSENFAKEP